MDLDSVISFEIGFIELRKPRELARIGVGYKDKGSLNTKVKAELPKSSFVDEKEDCFKFLISGIRGKYSKLLKA